MYEQGQQAESSTMTDISMNYLEALEQECVSKSSSSSHKFVAQSSNEWSESALKSDNHKVNFYTVFNFVSSERHRQRIRLWLSFHDQSPTVLPVF